MKKIKYAIEEKLGVNDDVEILSEYLTKDLFIHLKKWDDKIRSGEILEVNRANEMPIT